METLKELVNEIEKIFGNTDKTEIQRIIEEISKARRVFITGTGRSLLVGEMFAVRLVQMGITTYIVGDPITPSINKDDLLLAISGSGETHTTVYVSEQAKKNGAKIALITARQDSTLSKISDICVILPAKTKNELSDERFPLGTLFELSALLLLDGTVNELKKRRGITETDMKKAHANLE